MQIQPYRGLGAMMLNYPPPIKPRPEFQAYLLAEDRSRVTIIGYVGDVRLFAQWFEKQSKEPLTPGALTNEAVRGYKQFLLEQGNKPKTINRRLAALAAYAHWLEQAGYVQNARNPV